MMEKCKKIKALLFPLLKEWSETIKSRPLCTAAVVVILSVLLVRGLSGDIEVGPVYDIGGDNAVARAGIFEGDNISLSGKFYHIRLQDLGHEGEASGCTEVAFNDLDVAVRG